MCVQSFAISHDISQGDVLFLDKLRIRHTSLSSCHKHTSWADTTFPLRCSQLETTLKNVPLSLNFFPHIPPQLCLFYPLPPLKPTPPHKHNTPPLNMYVYVCVWVSSSLSLSMAGLWQQLSSLWQGRALALLHFICLFYLPSEALPWDTNASPTPPKVRYPNGHGKITNVIHT